METKRKAHDEFDKVKSIFLDSAKEIIERTIPVISETFIKIASGFLKSMGDSLKSDLAGKIEEKKKSITQRQEKKNGDSE